MVFQKKGEKVANNAHQSSNNMGVRIFWCKKGVRIVWLHPSYMNGNEESFPKIDLSDDLQILIFCVFRPLLFKSMELNIESKLSLYPSLPPLLPYEEEDPP